MMKEKATAAITEYELDEIRTLIERRSGILFDASRERFFSTRIREHMAAKHLPHGTDLLRKIRGSNVEYDGLIERLLTQETSSLPLSRSLRCAREKSAPRIAHEEILGDAANAAYLERRLRDGRGILLHRNHYRGCSDVRRCVEHRDPRHRY